MLIRVAALVATICSLATDACSETDARAETYAHGETDTGSEQVRFATFNVSLYDQAAGKLAQRLSTRNDAQAATVAEIIQRVRPDVLLLNEFDYDADGKALQHFQQNYLAIGQNVSDSPAAAQPIQYKYHFLAPSNTGQPSGHDLDRSGRVNSSPGDSAYGGDCWGYGEYPGKYAMVLLSRYPIKTGPIKTGPIKTGPIKTGPIKTGPINTDGARTFQNFRWRDMPSARLPDNPETAAPADWYSDDTLERFPLSSKSHWDVPIRIADRVVHLLASHPTPPTYDGPEDRNGRRNHDEIRFWTDYIDPAAADYIYDDTGRRGGLPAGEAFVVMGDLNGDPVDGQGKAGIRRLLDSPLVNPDPVPASDGGAQQAMLQGGANDSHRGNSRYDTLDAADSDGPGNLRVDYVIPARTIKTLASGVFWPKNKDRLFALVGTHPFPSSDHRLVWIDIEVVSGQ